jgi:glycosyltransferase involved in cell wall biosynthesis
MSESASNGVRRALYSHRLGIHRLAGAGTIPFGVAHYSHELVGRRILGALARLGIETHELIRPEIYSTPQAFESIKDFRRADIHLIFKPIEEIRILRGAYNIACVLWEFDQLNDRALTINPCSNHVRMLRMVDEVWCYCTFTLDVVRKYFANAHLIPVPFAAPGRMDQDRSGSKLPSVLSSIPAIRVASRNFGNLGGFLNKIVSMDFAAMSMFNPADWRKNVGNMLSAFALFQRDKPGAVLLLKLIVDNEVYRLDNALTLLDRYCRTEDVGQNVFVITKLLPANILTALYQFADFYVCTSHCEGLGMPIIEAMGHGTIPCAVNNTAMADYINDENSFVVPSVPEPARLETNSAMNPNLTWHTASVTSIARALERAYRSSPQARIDKRHAAIEMVRKNYSIEKSAAYLDARLRAASIAVAAGANREAT